MIRLRESLELSARWRRWRTLRRLWLLQVVADGGRWMRRTGATATWWADERIHAAVSGKPVRK